MLNKLIQMTDQLKAAGHRRLGMKMLFETIRYHTMLETRDAQFKMNNSYASRYVRILSDKRPDLAGMFEKRGLHS